MTRKQRVTFCFVGLVVCGFLFLAWVRLGPLPAGLLEAPVSTVVVDRHGEPLYEALSADGTRSMSLTAEELPEIVVAATVAAEDHRFWSHPGVDPLALLRAAKVNLVERRVVEGGSTISQQVAKLLLNRRDPGRHRGLRAKIDEAMLALRLERRLSKRELLAWYLNLAGYGNQIVGIERASQAYFGRSTNLLTPAQAAFLAGLPQRPSRFNPYRNRDLAMSRQRSVLRRMQEAGSLSAEQAQQAGDEALTLTRAAATSIAPHFVEMVVASLGDARPERVVTTLDSRLQNDVRGIIDSHRALLRAHGAGNVAVVVLDNASGEWLAWEGSGDYGNVETSGAINGPAVPRQPGSALKPFTYALAFEHGRTPATVLADVPAHFPTAEPGVVYSPRNYDGRYRGPLLARRALAGSQNVPAVALASDIGVPALLRFLARAGVTTFDKTADYYGLGVTLGNAEVRLDELVAAYALFARGGLWIPTTAVRSFAGRAEAPPSSTEAPRVVVSARTAFWISDILSDAEAREYAFGRGGSLEFPFPVAAKTGTSQAYHDNWTIGYSRRVTVGVWVGNFDRTPLRNSSGITGAAPIFHAVMVAAERRLSGNVVTFGSERLVMPTEVEHVDICALSGGVANAWCPVRRREWLPIGDARLPCDWHQHTESGVALVWPAAYREWAAGQNPGAPRNPTLLHARIVTPDVSRGIHAPSADAAGQLQITNPPAGATYLIDPTLRREYQTLTFTVVAPRSGRIEWLVDGTSIGSVAADGTLSWPLAPGTHRVTARDELGEIAERTIHVR